MAFPRRHRTFTLAVAAVLLLALAAVLSSSLGAGRAPRPKACLPYSVRRSALASYGRAPADPRVPDFSHVVVIMMENKECSQVLGSSQAPYLNGLGRRYAVLRDMYGTTHPSFPNYLAITSGSTLGATSDCSTCSYSARNLADQLAAARISWKIYAEGMPAPCSRASRAGNYAKRHVPFLSYADITRNPRRCADVVPLTALARDVRDRALPRFAWITPNLCDDMHDCGVRSGDVFLARALPPLLKAIGPRGVVFITWDEGTTKRSCCDGRARGGNIPTFVAGGAVRPHSAPATVYDAYSILRTIEDAWQLPHLRNAGCTCTHAIGGIWRGG